MKETIGEVRLWNTVGDVQPEGYNNVEYSTLAVKTEVAADIAAATAKQALITALGIPGPYADDAAAAAASIPVGRVYFVTTTLRIVTRMA